MDEAQIERRAEERGGMKADIKNLTNIVEVGFRAINSKVDTGFAGLECANNSKKIDEMYITYKDNKALRQHTAKTIISQILKWSAQSIIAGLAGATAVFAYFK